MRAQAATSAIFQLFFFIGLTFGNSAFGDAGLNAELVKMAQFKEGLRQLGVPNDELALDYLTIEIFYNIPSRRVVAPSLRDVQLRDFHISFNDSDNVKIQNRFPGVPFSAEDHWKSIQITGHDSRFVWNVEHPEFHFIWKATDDDNIHHNEHAMEIFREALQRIPDIQFDYVYEGSLSGGMMRTLSTARQRAGDHIFPLHGFLGSPLFLQMALAHGLTPFDFLDQKLMPHFADFMFDMAFRVGIREPSHTQNLWLVVNDNGAFHLAHKDHEYPWIDFLTRQNDPTYNGVGGNIYLDAENHLTEVNASVGGESPRTTEPAFNFASYAYQTIILSDLWSFSQKAHLLKSFLSRFIERANTHYGIQIQLSPKSQDMWSRLETLTHDYDVRGFSLWTGEGWTTYQGGLYAYSEAVMREIVDQVYAKILGPRQYPRDEASQMRLKIEYGRAPFRYQISPLKIAPLDKRVRKESAVTAVALRLPRFLRDVAHEIYRAYQYSREQSGIHFEKTDRYVLMVTSDGRILDATLRPTCGDFLTKSALDPLR